MVDSINPLAQTQNIQPVKGNAQKSKDSEDSKGVFSPVDAVEISEEALNLAQAEDAAKAVASSLSDNVAVTLSSDPGRLDALV